LKIWNNTRGRDEPRAAPAIALESGMDALSSQINRIFLFNTLNTVSALIRFDPDSALRRGLRLSNILRRLLRQARNVCAVARGAAIHRHYLDIEVARFGKDNLDIVKHRSTNRSRFMSLVQHDSFTVAACFARCCFTMSRLSFPNRATSMSR